MNISGHGHPSLYTLIQNITDMHSAKNRDYALGGDPLGNFKRVATIKRIYPGLPWDSPTGVAIGYMLKQLDAACWMLSQGYEGQVETFAARMQDVAVYSLLAIINKEEEATP